MDQAFSEQEGRETKTYNGIPWNIIYKELIVGFMGSGNLQKH
jgi:hypothetical protein